MDAHENTHLFCLPPSVVTLAAASVASAALGAAAVVSVVLFVGARAKNQDANKKQRSISLPLPTSTTPTPPLAQVDASSRCPDHDHHDDNSENAAPRCSSAFVTTTKGDPFDARPRSRYLSWDDYFMALAFLSAQRSKDPNKQVGACIVSPDRIILGIGYNGFPRGCADSTLPWAKRSASGGALATKYPYVCHAEMNAVLNKNAASVAGATMYVTMFPCNECSKLLIQAGIGEVVFYEDKQGGGGASHGGGGSTPASGGMLPSESYAASRRMLSLAGVRTRQHSPAEELVLKVSPLQSSSKKKKKKDDGDDDDDDDDARRVLHAKAA